MANHKDRLIQPFCCKEIPVCGLYLMRKSNSLYIKGEQLGVTMLHKPVKLYVFHNDAERIQRDINIEPSQFSIN